MSLSVTTNTSLNKPVATVLSYTWQMMDLLPSNCISLPGKRVAAYRAGITAIMFIGESYQKQLTIQFLKWLFQQSNKIFIFIIGIITIKTIADIFWFKDLIGPEQPIPY